MTHTELPIACTLTAKEQRAWQGGMGRTIFEGYDERRELPDGYALRFPGDDAWANALMEFIIHERECCPFFTFGLVFEPNHGAIWLHLTGNEGVRTFVEALMLRPKIEP